MPHIHIKHFKRTSPLTEEQKTALAEKITQAVTDVLDCEAGAVSIALEAIEPTTWEETVYIPEILNQKELLCKFPAYSY